MKTVHIKSAWDLTGQAAADEKSNENTAVPRLLARLDLHDHIVTSDAVGA